ncbi:TraY domain-containing protein [Vibrio sp. WXL103]|uniref:TraY domain-containing protein n=1 Tax=Vibrio sp. WXL103 TaxID=3450710 RepID=UPI003EC5E518
MNKSERDEEKSTAVNVELDSKTNRRLEDAAQASGRTKRKEAAARLKHHLEHFEGTWSLKD